MCPRGFVITEIAAELLHNSNKDNTDDEEAKVEDDNDNNGVNDNDTNTVDNNADDENNIVLEDDQNVVDNNENDKNDVDSNNDVKETVVPPPFVFQSNLSDNANSSTLTTTSQKCAPLGKCLWHQVTTM
jgi:hypothetical protein